MATNRDEGGGYTRGGIGSGTGGGGVWGGTSGSSAANSKTYGKRIQVVFGTATVSAVPLTVEANGDGLAKVQYGLAAGVIESVDGIVYRDQLYGPTTIMGHQVAYSIGHLDAPEFTLGDVATAATWSEYAAATTPEWRTPYGPIACLRSSRMVVPDGSTNIGTVKAVVRGFCAATRNTAREDALGNHWDIYDAHPADVLTYLIENTEFGLGYPAGTCEVDHGADGGTASSYRTFCTAHAMLIALAIDEKVQVVEVVAQILQATNSVGVWDGGKFRVVPLGDLEVGSYVPVLTALSVGDDDIELNGNETVKVRRGALRDAVNVVPVQWSQDNDYRDVDLVTSQDMDAANASRFGPKVTDPVPLPCIRTEAHALKVSRWLSERAIYSRDEWEFTVSPRIAPRIRVGDVLALSHAAMGVADRLIRVTETDEDTSGKMQIRAATWVTARTYERVTPPNRPAGDSREAAIQLRSRSSGTNYVERGPVQFGGMWANTVSAFTYGNWSGGGNGYGNFLFICGSKIKPGGFTLNMAPNSGRSSIAGSVLYVRIAESYLGYGEVGGTALDWGGGVAGGDVPLTWYKPYPDSKLMNGGGVSFGGAAYDAWEPCGPDSPFVEWRGLYTFAICTAPFGIPLDGWGGDVETLYTGPDFVPLILAGIE